MGNSMPRATLIHHSLNGRGGSEFVAVATLEILHAMGFKTDLITIHKPGFDALKSTFDTDLPINSVRSLLSSHIDYKRSIYHQTLVQLLTIPLTFGPKADLVVNTEADVPLPYFFDGTPLISYIHFPFISHMLTREYPARYQRGILWKIYYAPYHLLIRRILAYLAQYTVARSVILTNSEFSRKAIKSIFPKANPIVVRPPVNTQAFARALLSGHRENKIIVVGRVIPEKRFENAIELFRLLPEHIKGTIIP